MPKKFPLGRLVATPRALEAFNGKSYWPYVERHSEGDWGYISQDDKAENELSLKCGFRIFSAYTLPKASESGSSLRRIEAQLPS
jgi:hypothetical protein